MSRRFRFDAGRVGIIGALLPSLCLIVSACGGGGGSEVSSLPPPPAPPGSPPPPPAAALTVISGFSLVNSLDVRTSRLDSPATRIGNYDLIGRLTLTHENGNPSSFRPTSPGEFTMQVVQPGSGGFNYLLKASDGVLPGSLTAIGPASIVNSWDISSTVAYRYGNPYGDWSQSLGQRLTAFDRANNGSETQLFSFDLTRGSANTHTSLGSGRSLEGTLDYDIGYSHVAMGEWSWRVVDLNGAAVGESGDLLFVNGDRTPGSGIPVSGTATYDARTLALLSSNGTAGIPFTLTADFGQQTISTRIDQDYRYNSANPAGDPILGIHVGGRGSFSNAGLFDIPLSGTVNYASTNVQNPPSAEPATGVMNGAFFGPHAEQVGGTLSLQRPDESLLLQDAFVGKQGGR